MNAGLREILLPADEEWEPATDAGEGNKRDWSQEKRGPAEGRETHRETYPASHQESVSVCASETHELSPNQQLVHLVCQLLGPCAGLKSFALA